MLDVQRWGVFVMRSTSSSEKLESATVLRSDGTGDREHFASVEVAGRAEHPYSRRDEHFDVFLCRGFTGDLRKAWAGMKKFE